MKWTIRLEAASRSKALRPRMLAATETPGWRSRLHPAPPGPRLRQALVSALQSAAFILGSVRIFGSRSYLPKPDPVVAEYREFTGAAPLLPLWAYGFWQCRERYSSQQQIRKRPDLPS